MKEIWKYASTYMYWVQIGSQKHKTTATTTLHFIFHYETVGLIQYISVIHIFYIEH